MLLQLLIVVVKITEFFWQDVGVRCEIECRLAKLLLHPYNVKAKSILASYLVGLRKLVYFLVLVQAFILVVLARTAGPQ
jgi:hypothetical protein